MNDKSDLDIALDDAIARADLSEVEDHLVRGANPNGFDPLGSTPLMNAAWVAAPDVIRLLLRWGADPLVVNPEGKTALDLARSICHNRYGYDDVIVLLLTIHACGGQ